jgi:hypothetical protein
VAIEIAEKVSVRRSRTRSRSKLLRHHHELAMTAMAGDHARAAVKS